MRTVAVMRDEEWRPIPGFIGYYEASSLGRIRSLPRRGKKRNRVYGGQIRKPVIAGNGYYGVRLSVHNVKRTYMVHELVCAAFHGAKPSPGRTCEVRHLDGNPLNCRADNLCWGTHSENELDKVRHGTHRWSKMPTKPLTSVA